MEYTFNIIDPTKEPVVEGSGTSATDPITIDLSPAKNPPNDQIISIESSPEQATKPKYIGYAGYGAKVTTMWTGYGRSAVTKKNVV